LNTQIGGRIPNKAFNANAFLQHRIIELISWTLANNFSGIDRRTNAISNSISGRTHTPIGIRVKNEARLAYASPISADFLEHSAVTLESDWFQYEGRFTVASSIG
jgi:hypothetical protein